ncbi:hypothetical protein F4861DRAFT_207052 [Xylaria intraflava]|nr:hypothetical protein F4861DRAFT_207052 [Xylaria intraflava]
MWLHSTKLAFVLLPALHYLLYMKEPVQLMSHHNAFRLIWYLFSSKTHHTTPTILIGNKNSEKKRENVVARDSCLMVSVPRNLRVGNCAVRGKYDIYSLCHGSLSFLKIARRTWYSDTPQSHDDVPAAI